MADIIWRLENDAEKYPLSEHCAQKHKVSMAPETMPEALSWVIPMRTSQSRANMANYLTLGVSRGYGLSQEPEGKSQSDLGSVPGS